jgi:hypothetical protein
MPRRRPYAIPNTASTPSPFLTSAKSGIEAVSSRPGGSILIAAALIEVPQLSNFSERVFSARSGSDGTPEPYDMHGATQWQRRRFV